MKKIILLFTLGLFTILCSIEIDLDEAVNLAKENNKDIQASKFSLSAARWGKYEALSNFFPQVSFNSTIVRIDDETYKEANEPIQIPSIGMQFPAMFPVEKTTYTNNITMKQPIFNGGKIFFGYQLADLARKQEKIALDNKKNDISYAVASTYFNYLKLKDIQTLNEKSLSSAQSHLKTVEKKQEVGAATRSDVLQWQVKVNNAKTARFAVENNIKEIISYWENLIGSEGKIPSEIQLKIFDDEIKRYADMDNEGSVEAKEKFLEKVKTSSRTLMGMELAKKMMKKNYLMQKGNFLPAFNLQFDYQFESDGKFDLDGNDNWNLAAVISLPLFTSGANFSKVKKAKYELLKTQKKTDYTKENYLLAAENVFNQMITKARIVKDNKTETKLAEENHKIINQLYEEGMAINSELLDAETMLYSSKMKLIESYFDFVLMKYEMKKYINIVEE